MAKTITHTESDEALFGEVPHLTLVGKRSFSDMIFELLSERQPSPDESVLFAVILNCSIDHGEDTPSAVETIRCAKEGASISESVARGIMKIDNQHGGAQEPLMKLLDEIAAMRISPAELVAEHIRDKKRIPGFGHRIYNVDPRAALIVRTMKDLGCDEKYMEIGAAIAQELKAQLPEKELPMNIDGAIAIALSTLHWKPEWSTAAFLIARSAGLSGQYLNHRNAK